ncbi:AMP-binding protein [Deinococcus altitudinis]|uniref:AMP-binding protein n=1 Tax=Deinococcus altitudinis TaxID=468914 RepID=UPI00389163D5
MSPDSPSDPPPVPGRAESVASFQAALKTITDHRQDYEAQRAAFAWPVLGVFNWADDVFRPLAARMGEAPALVWDGASDVASPGGPAGPGRQSYAELEAQANRLAHLLTEQGVRPADRVLLMVSGVPELWAVFLAAIRIGAVVIPATTLLSAHDLPDRLTRGEVKHVVTEAGETGKFEGLTGFTRFSVGAAEGWTDLRSASATRPDTFTAVHETLASDPLLLYFTSGTTSRPKLVTHSHQSYPAGSLSTLAWLGLQAGDVHWNISSPGWAKHAWSNFFVPLTVGAAVVVDSERFDPRRTLEWAVRLGVTSLCAPPTVWRMLIQQPLAEYRGQLRSVVGAGEPLNPEVIEVVGRAWNLPLRDGFGQTETTAQVGNTPGQPVKAGSMGRPLPGFRVVLTGPDGQEADEGELSLDLSPRPLGLMSGYAGDPVKTQAALAGRYYGTGDVARRDADGYLFYVGRTDDVFKSADYRISPFELESLLIEHPQVAEAAVVPSPHPERLNVPKAYVVTTTGTLPSRELAAEILAFARERLGPFKRVRRLEFSELPKTVSGKIRRVELRAHAAQGVTEGRRSELEFWEEDFGG